MFARGESVRTVFHCVGWIYLCLLRVAVAVVIVLFLGGHVWEIVERRRKPRAATEELFHEKTAGVASLEAIDVWRYNSPPRPVRKRVHKKSLLIDDNDEI
jgi:hypothetical protein